MKVKHHDEISIDYRCAPTILAEIFFIFTELRDAAL
jgi:hypothetical protein